MNYTLILAGNGGDIANITLGIIEREPWQRPQVNQQIDFHDKTYVVLSCSPANNPDNATVSYIIELFNPNFPYKR